MKTTRDKLKSIFAVSLENQTEESPLNSTMPETPAVPTTVQTSATDPLGDAEFGMAPKVEGESSAMDTSATATAASAAEVEPTGQFQGDEAPSPVSETAQPLETTPVAPVMEDTATPTEAEAPKETDIGEGVVALIETKTEEAMKVALENDESATEAVLVVLDSEEVKDAIATLPEDANVVEVELPAEVVEDIEELDSGVDEEVMETADAMASEAEEVIQEAMNAQVQSETLSTYAEALESFKSTADLKDADITMFQLSIESFASTCGVEGTDIVPSLFKLNTSAESMETSLEEINKLSVGVEAGVFDAARKVISSIGKFFSFIFKSYNSILVKTKKLRADIKAAKTLESRKITVSNLHRLHVGGKVDPASIIKGLDATAKVAGEIYGPYYKQLQTLYKDAGMALVNTKRSFAKNADDLSDVFGDHGERMMKDYGRLSKLAENNPEMSGGKVFALTNGLQTLPAVQDKDGNPSVMSKQEVPSLTAEQAIKVLDSVENVVSVVRERIYKIVAGDNGIDAIIGAWKKDAQVNPGFFKFFSRALKAANAAVIFNSLTNGRLYQPINGVSYNAFGAVNAAVAYVSKSVK